MKPRKVRALEALLDEARSLFYQLRAAAEEIQEDLDISVGQRAILSWIGENGPATVPEIARARKVSRQHIQSVVNRFAARGLVSSEDNPAHRRSSIVQLTGQGRVLVEELDRREVRIWRALDLEVKRRDMDDAAGVLSRLRRLLESAEWHRAVKDSRS
jgi:DNA-binding MarR family transcriptional regulator